MTLGSNRFFGSSYDEELRAGALMTELAGFKGASVGNMGSDIRTPGDYLELERHLGTPRLGETLPQYSYYGSPYPGAQPQQSSDWDKFMQFHNSMMPALTGILGTWLEGRAMVQSSQEMAKAFSGMTDAQRAQVMQGLLVNQMVAQQGGQQTLSPQMATNMMQGFQMLPPGQFNSAYQNAMGGLSSAAGGNPQIMQLLQQQGQVIQGAATMQFPVWAIAVGVIGLGAVAYFTFIAPKM